MTIIRSFLEPYGLILLYAVCTAVAGFLGTQCKRISEKLLTDNTKLTIVQVCVQAVEQLYKGLHGPQKKQKAMESVFTLLAEKRITITPLEMDLLIESAVAEFNAKRKSE